jgi:hypothetical protein
LRCRRLWSNDTGVRGVLERHRLIIVAFTAATLVGAVPTIVSASPSQVPIIVTSVPSVAGPEAGV